MIRHRVRPLFLTALLVGAVAGCSDQEVVCTTEIQPGLYITVVDRDTREPLPSVITVRDGAYVEMVSVPARTELYTAADERPGIYEIEVASDGYQTEIVQDVEVTQGTCHVHTVDLEVELVPATE